MSYDGFEVVLKIILEQRIEHTFALVSISKRQSPTNTRSKQRPVTINTLEGSSFTQYYSVTRLSCYFIYQLLSI